MTHTHFKRVPAKLVTESTFSSKTISDKRKKTQSGSLLIISTFTISLFSTLLVGYLLIVTSDLKISGHDAWGRQARYVAEAGIHEAIYQLSLNNAWSAGFSNAVLITNQTYSVSVSNTSPTITLTSSGTANGYTRQISVNLSISGQKSSGRYRVRINTWEEL